MKKIPYYPPGYEAGAFNCPHCGVYAKQVWFYISIHVHGIQHMPIESKWRISLCEHCQEKTLWLDEKIIYPREITVETANQDLSDDIKKIYNEAAEILSISPRASAALLRLALQKLCKELGEKGENINDDIKSLVAKGLDPIIQKALDTLRIVGNNAVHPGKINVEEKPELVPKLFGLINIIAEDRITNPKNTKALYEKITTEKDKEKIKKRDNTKKR